MAYFNDYEREELEAEFFAEDPGAAAARCHNEWEAYWEAVEMEEAVAPNALSDDELAEKIENEVLEAKFNGKYD